jgi:hypothetical protein
LIPNPSPYYNISTSYNNILTFCASPAFSWCHVGEYIS